tara:strand:+ start:24 stop:437 length:414 start_codon:yes stop_codon:yes gene_type:complete
MDINDRLEEIKKKQNQRKNSISRLEGRASQDRARELLGIPDNPMTKSSEEEYWNSGEVRYEVKSGKQVNETISKFEKAESQSWEYELTQEEQRELFAMIMMPHGTKDGVFICRMSQLRDIVNELSILWTKGEEDGLD